MKFLNCLLLLFLITTTIIAQESDNYLELENKSLKNWTVKVFRLDKEQYLPIVATGQTINDVWLAKAWILDSHSRRPVWEMDLNNTHPISNEGRRRFMGDLKLNAGVYELYFGVDESVKEKSRGISKFLDDLLDNLDYYEHDARRWGVDIHPDTENGPFFHVLNIDEIKDQEPAAIKLAPVGNNSAREATFSLPEEQSLHIYMIGEGMRKSSRMYDYGWITNLDTRKRVWQADIRDSKHAGGADKNRLFDTIITLPAGLYSANYITDDTHSADRFNQMPPLDPMHWGLTIYADKGILAIDKIQKHNTISTKEPIVEFTHVGNNAFYCKGFEINGPLTVHIVAMGEYSRSIDGFADHGWIINAHTRKKVWDMSLENTYHAGGSQKNKMADETITLGPGAYKVYYVSNESHAYDSWDNSPPTNPEQWGITITPDENTENEPQIQPYSEKDDPAIIASIKQVADSEHRRKSFTLDKKEMVRVYAIGEGDTDGMYDYGWIEDQDDQTIWEMTFPRTRHAGGAIKNRIANTIIELEAGTYTLHYITDDSHSFESWNSIRPDDFPYWGITLIKTDYDSTE